MFDGNRSFNQPLDNWDISEIQNENLEDMFRDAPFKQPYCKWKKWSAKK